MHEIGQDGPASISEDVEIFNGLRLAGSSGKMRMVLDNQTMTFEGRLGRAMGMRLDNIVRIHHHHSKMIPLWLAITGVVLIWIGWRILTPEHYRVAAMIAGFSLLALRYGTQKPTVFIDTVNGDCHAIFAPETTLMRLTHMANRVQQGLSIIEAREGLEILNSDLDYPVTSQLEEIITTPEPIHLESPDSISTFLGIGELIDDEAGESSTNEFELDLEVDAFAGLPDWFDEEEEEENPYAHLPSSGLISRGIANAGDRRGPYSPPTQDRPQYQQPYPVLMPDNHGPQVPSMHQQTHGDPRLYQTQHYPQQAVSQTPPMYQEAGPSQLPEPLPSFWNSEGAHIPAQSQPNQAVAHQQENTDSFSMFNSPDSLGSMFPDEDESTSLVAGARRGTHQPEPVFEADLIEEEKAPESFEEKYPNLRVKPAGIAKHSRLQLKQRVPQTGSRGVVRNLVMPTLGRAASSASRTMSSAATSASRLLLGDRPESPERDETAESLRVRSDQTHQSEVLDSIANLAQSRGGHLPDEEVERMYEHISRRHSISEQLEEEQEEDDSLESISFKDLVDSKSHNASTAGANGLPRLDH